MGVREHSHIQAFAWRLRELKERSGRSFEALAARAQVSRSALHRYCAGRAVPVEYVAVDRFARHCGADRDELIDLYRLWVLADAARQRSEPSARPASKSAALDPAVSAPAVPDPLGRAEEPRPAWPARTWARRRAWRTRSARVGVVAAVVTVVAVTVLGLVRPRAATSAAAPG